MTNYDFHLQMTEEYKAINVFVKTEALFSEVRGQEQHLT